MRKSLYICYFNTEEPLVHTQVLPYLRAVARAGTQVHLLTFEKRGARQKGERGRRLALRQQLAASGIRWHTLGYHKWPPLLATGYDMAVGSLYSAYLIARHRIDIIHARSHVSGVMGLALKRLLGKKLIFDLRGLLAEEYVDNKVWAEGSLPFRMVKSAERRLLKNSDHVVMLTERLKNEVLVGPEVRAERSRISVIPCCVDLSKYTADRKEGAADRFTIVYSGSASGRYMLGEMVDFFAVLKNEVDNAHFLVITKTDPEEVRRAFTSRNVGEDSYTITSAEPGEMPALLKGCDLGISFITPTRALAGASPTKIGEYLAAGLPVISSSGAGDTDRILTDNRIGVLIDSFEPRTYRDAAQKALQLLEEGAGARSRDVAERVFSLEDVGGPRYKAVYDSLTRDDKREDKDEGRADRKAPFCPLCAATDNASLGEAREGIRLRKCASCGFVFHKEFSDETELQDYYSHYYQESNLAFSPITESRFQQLVASFEGYREGNRILDIGCGSGHLLKVAMNGGWSAYGTEIASGALDHLARLGINTFNGKLQSARYPDEHFDVIYCSEVIEHLLDPTSLLREAARILRPGGLLYLTTPNYNSLSRRLIGYEWRVFGKEHVGYFTPRTLSRALKEAGFRRADVSTRNIDPGELKKHFGKRPASGGTGFQIDRTEQLREQLETKRSMKLAKKVVNTVLSATGTGDTICVRAGK